jgi:hypothetical protein
VLGFFVFTWFLPMLVFSEASPTSNFTSTKVFSKQKTALVFG